MLKNFETGFHDDTTEHEVETLLVSTIVEAGMLRKGIQIKCPANLITHAFLQFTDSEARDKYIRSANMQRRGFRERKISISLVLDAGKISTTKTGIYQILLEQKA